MSFIKFAHKAPHLNVSAPTVTRKLLGATLSISIFWAIREPVISDGFLYILISLFLKYPSSVLTISPVFVVASKIFSDKNGLFDDGIKTQSFFIASRIVAASCPLVAEIFEPFAEEAKLDSFV